MEEEVGQEGDEGEREDEAEKGSGSVFGSFFS